eukprot:CAMPEP_0194202758 /NCGR_PEP_ID=MMETSP0156-20130528/2696_1 /TAXON_ID=33649 /ORGANISM="Thalassionema nitzschioides, Strain L26-B" /LENGTH=406 /DNA_ID=CAMNT_0038928337 /DNA_START=256 /DNA_END=1476 /DNA_ORIENTATION=+
MTQWIENQEASGKTNPPICPFCRIALSEEDILSLLGRPFQPKGLLSSTTSPTAIEEVDELTLQLLQEQTRQCSSCGAHIEKIPGGCDLMECLCGYRFCYGCGMQDAKCSCTPSHHYFWDNILDHHAQRYTRAQAKKDEETGYVLDLKNHIVMRKVQDYRARKRAEVEREQRDVDEFFLSAKWLFRPRQSALRILNELGDRKQVRRLRHLRARKRNREDEYVSENFMRARWIFCSKKATLQMLEQQIHAERVKKRRKWNARRILNEQRDVGEIFMSARWLFCEKRKAASVMLDQQTKAEEVQRARKRKEAEEEETITEIDAILRNGSWLFKKKSSASKHLSRLLNHHARMERLRCEQSLARLWDYVTDDDDDDDAIGERENALSIRLLFLTEDEKAVERAEMEECRR